MGRPEWRGGLGGDEEVTDNWDVEGALAHGSAAEILLTGRHVSAEEAKALGMIGPSRRQL